MSRRCWSGMQGTSAQVGPLAGRRRADGRGLGADPGPRGPGDWGRKRRRSRAPENARLPLNAAPQKAAAGGLHAEGGGLPVTSVLRDRMPVGVTNPDPWRAEAAGSASSCVTVRSNDMAARSRRLGSPRLLCPGSETFPACHGSTASGFQSHRDRSVGHRVFSCDLSVLVSCENKVACSRTFLAKSLLRGERVWLSWEVAQP